MNYQEFLPNAIGLIGVSFVVFAYFQLQTHRWKANEVVFPMTNLMGAICILFSLLFNWNLSSVVIELIWISISCYGLFRILKSGRKRKRPPNDFHPLSSQEIAGLEKELKGDWENVEKKYLRKTWVFDSYSKSIDFVNRVAAIAERENHHPVFLIEYKKVTLTLWTHNVNALTKADYDLVAKLSKA